MGGWWPSMWCRLGLWHHWGRIPSPPGGHPLGRNGLPTFPPQFHLSLCRLAAVTETWQLQNNLVSMSWLPLWAPPLSSSSWPYLWFWIQPWPGPSQSRSWLVWPVTAHPHRNFWSLGSEGLSPQTWGMGWQKPVPSSSNNQPRGWICSARSLQNW